MDNPTPFLHPWPATSPYPPCPSSPPLPSYDNQCTKLLVFQKKRGCSSFLICLVHRKELKFLFLFYSYQLRIYSYPTLSFFFRDLAPPVLSLCISSTSPFVLRVTRLWLAWTIPLYSYCSNIIISNDRFHSQKCLFWVIYYMVLFISDYDLQPRSCSNSPIPKTPSRHTHSKTYAQSHISLSLLHSYIFWRYCPYLLSPFFYLPLFLYIVVLVFTTLLKLL